MDCWQAEQPLNRFQATVDETTKQAVELQLITTPLFLKNVTFKSKGGTQVYDTFTFECIKLQLQHFLHFLFDETKNLNQYQLNDLYKFTTVEAMILQLTLLY
jgi:hypothetical protein